MFKLQLCIKTFNLKIILFNSQIIRCQRLRLLMVDTPCQCNNQHTKVAVVCQGTRLSLFHKCSKTSKKWMFHRRCKLCKTSNNKEWLCSTQDSILFHKRMGPVCHIRLLCSRASNTHSRPHNNSNKLTLCRILILINKIRIWFTTLTKGQF